MTAWQFEKVAPIQQPNPPCVRGMTLAGFDHDPQGRPVLAWREENDCGGPPKIFWARKDGGAWNPTQFLSGLHYDGSALDGYFDQFILRPSDGNPFLVYRDVAPGNYLNTYESDLGASPSGGNPVFLESLVGPQTCAYMTYALAFAPHAVTPDWATVFIGCNQFGDIRLDGARVAGISPAGPALAVSPNGTRHLLWTDGPDAFADGPAGITHLFSNLNLAGGETAVVSDASGVLHAIVRGIESDADWDLGAMVYISSADDGLTWTPFVYVDPDNDASPGSIGANSDISMAVDSQGIPAVTFWRFKQELWYARRDGPGGTWTKSLVTTMPYTGKASARLDFDADDLPVIAYFDAAAQAIQLARPLPAGATPPIDISLAGAATPSTIQPGGDLTYKLTLTNHGITNVDHVLLTNQLPAGATYVDASPRPDATGHWPIGLLSAGGSTTITVFAKAPNAQGDAVDVASVTSDGPDVAPGNNAVAIGTTVCASTCGEAASDGLDIAANVSVVPNPVIANGVVTFVVKVTNVGSVDAASVTLVNTLPAGVTVIDTAPGPSSTAGSDQTVTVGALPAGASAWFVVHAQAPLTAATLTDTAHVSASGDTNPSNDTASASTVVKPDACFVPTAGLIAHWRGDGNANDDSGTHSGTREGADTYAPGHVGQAFSFNGTDDDIFIANTPDLRPANFTASAWVRPTTFHPGGWNVAFTGGRGFWLGFANQQPALYTHLSGNLTIAPLPVPQNEWYLLTATWDGATATLYVNGLPVAASAIAEPLIWDEQELFGIGGFWAGGRNQTYERFDGLIDEVTLHDRALSAAEVLGLYDGSSPCAPTNRPPTLTDPGPQTAAEGASVTLPLTATDPDGDPLTFSAVGLPPGLSIDPSSGSIGGALPYTAAGSYTPTATVDDGHGGSASVTFNWTVTHTIVFRATTLTLSSSASPAPSGTAVTFTAAVAAVPPGGAPPSGVVAFIAVGSNVTLATVALDGAGIATLTTSALPAGTFDIRAVYAGTPSFAGSSATITQTVEFAASTPIRNGDPEASLQFNGVGMILASPTHGSCTATLVSRWVVLTTAQCLLDTAPNPVFEFSLGGGRIARLTDIRQHPLFNTVEGVSRAYDVALAKLDESAANGWTDIVLPALTDSAPALPINGTAVGFGQLDAVSGAPMRTSGALLMTQYVPDFDVDFNPIPDAYIEVEPGTATEQMFCPAGNGGPLFVQGRIAGIAAFRNVATCADDGPGYYINVSRLADWILSTAEELTGTAHRLTVDVSGGGSVAGLTAGACSTGECHESFPTGTAVTLTATAAAHFRFSGWEGCLSAAGRVCTIVMDAPKRVVAHFEDRPTTPHARITLVTPGPIDATGPLTAVPLSAATSTDPDSTAPIQSFVWSVDQQQGTGATFTPWLSVGSHFVTLLATDADGHTGFAAKTVTVRDRTDPVLTLPASPYPVSVGALPAQLPGGIVTAVDGVDGTVAVTCAPTVLSLGTNIVRCEAADASGNRARGSFKVDVTFPALTAAADALLAATQSAGGATAAMLNAAQRLPTVIRNGNDAGICPALANYHDAVQAALSRGKISGAVAGTLQSLASAVAPLASCEP